MDRLYSIAFFITPGRWKKLYEEYVVGKDTNNGE